MIGYKCFNKDMTNRYGVQFKVGEIYHTIGEIQFGNNGNGFHICSNMVDVFRYYNAMNEEVSVCEVKGSGEMITFNDEYYGYYDMYSVECMEIVREIDRNEIINMVLRMNEFNVLRFIQLFKLNSFEIELFEEKYSEFISILLAIDYYQNGILDVYKKYYSGNYVRKRKR